MSSPSTVALATFTLLLASVVSDLRSRTVPDLLPVALVLLGMLATWRAWHAVSWGQLGVGLAAGFVIGATLFYLGAMGGGDAKLSAGLGAVCGWPMLLEVWFATALVGGALAAWAKRRGMSSLPYAPAFAGGYATTMAIGLLLPPKSGLWHLLTGQAA